jgi:RNA polymerase sigma-70 factor (ECF subfamily)
VEEKNDIRDLNELYQTYRERFVRFAQTYVSVREIAEDIVMESFMSYWENRRQMAPGSNAPAYIFTLVRNKCLNYLCRLRKREEVEEYLASLDAWELNLRISTLEACNPDKLFSGEIRQLIHKALDSLPEKTREVFLRSRYHDQCHKQIAQAMNLSAKSVEYHITKALKMLRNELKDYYPLVVCLFSYAWL